MRRTVGWQGGDGLRPKSGRVMEVFTVEPGIQFYSGNFLDGTNIGKDRKVYKHRTASVWRPSTSPTRRTSPNSPRRSFSPEKSTPRARSASFPPSRPHADEELLGNGPGFQFAGHGA